MTEQKISTHNILNGGIIEKLKIEGSYYVKSIIDGDVNFSDLVTDCKANYFVFDAVNNGNVKF